MEDLPAAQAFCTFLTDFLFSNFIFFTYENMGSLKKLLSTTSRFMDVVDEDMQRTYMTEDLRIGCSGASCSTVATLKGSSLRKKKIL